MLIVDDEPLTRQFFLRNVGKLHPEWACAGEAGDGEEALAMIEAGRRFDLILTDIKMPGMSGLELARTLSARSVSPHIAVLSGHDEFALAKEAMEYGVHHYLLKPVVNEELVDMLDKVAGRIAAERAEEASYRSLLSLSAETREQVARNVLRAIVTDNHMEIKVLYPMLHRLKMSPLDAEGTILLTDLDESELFAKRVSAGSETLYRYIVHQTAVELADAFRSPEAAVIPFIDPKQRTVIFVAGEDGDDVLRRCQELFRELARTVCGMTKLRLWGACGNPELELLQLGAAYRQASNTLKQMLFADPANYAELLREDEEAAARRDRLDKTLAALQTAVAERREPQQRALLQGVAGELAPIDRRKLMLFGVAMLQRLAAAFPEEARQGRIVSALHAGLPQDDSADPAEEVAPEAAAALLWGLLERFREDERSADGSEANGAAEHETVTKVKAYIMEHYAEPLSLAHFAERLGVSSGYLSSLFHQNTQESYIKFLTRVRMEQAAALLSEKPAAKVYDVAEKVGYVSVKHFSYVFKQHYGIPPGQYQEKSLR